ncbi:MAG: TolC family protein [Burkholderiales bacterium]
MSSRASLLLAGAALLGACTTACTTIGPDYREPAAQVDSKFAFGDGFDAGEPVAAFWQRFDDPVLDRIVTRALAANHDLRIADARLQEARGIRRDAEGERFPSLIANTGYTMQQFSTAEFPGPRSARNRDAFFARLEPFWEIDFFGRVRRSIEARVAELGAAEAGLYAAQVAVVGEVARSYFELRGAQRERTVAQSNAENQRQTLTWTQARLDAGRGTELDTARAAAQLESTLAILPLLEERITRALLRLGVLIGARPNALAGELNPAPSRALPELGGIGTPEQLLRRRPDIRIAERQLAASTARVGVAVGDLFPRVIISGRLGFQSRGLLGLGSSDSVSYGLGPSIQWGAFDFTRVRARIATAESRVEGQLAAYEQTISRALEETEGALVAYTLSRTRQGALERAARASEQAVKLSRLRFEAGASDFLAVLDAERRLLADQTALASSETSTATALVAVYKALGGGWRPVTE